MATILIVEADRDTAAVLDLVLCEEGYQVVQATDGQAALDRLATVQPQLVLFELNLPGMDGRTLCRTLATDPQYQVIPRVLMSVWWEADDVACVTAVLPKPFTMPVLLQTVQRYVRAP